MTFKNGNSLDNGVSPEFLQDVIPSEVSPDGTRDSGHTNLVRKILACLMIFMLSGTLATLSHVSGYVQVALLAFAWMILPFAGKKGFGAMPRAGKFFAVWLVFVVFWGVLGSPVTPLYSGVKAICLAITMMAVVWVTGSDRATWRFAAMLAPLGIILNLYVSYLLMNNGALRAWFTLNDMVSQESSTQFRYGGLWGNANEAGLEALILVLISLWGPRWTAAVGFVCGAIMIAITASRTGIYSLVALSAVFGFYFYRSYRSVRVGILIASPVIIAVLVLGAFPGLNQDQLVANASQSTGIGFARVFDPFERETDQARTRAANFNRWTDKVDRMPWYGYGFNAESGTAPSNADAGHPELPWLGTHDTYLGILIDNGVVGLATFIILLMAGLTAAIRAKLAPWNKAILLSLWFVFLIFGAFAHSIHLLPHGEVLLMLCFLGPGLPAMYLVGSPKSSGVRNQHPPAGSNEAFLGDDARAGILISPDLAGGFRKPGRIRAQIAKASDPGT